MPFARLALVLILLLPLGCGGDDGEGGGGTPTFADEASAVTARIRKAIDAVPAISNHDHLRPSGRMPFQDLTPPGMRVTLHSLWAGSYLSYLTDIPPWPADRSFARWWESARHIFDRMRAVGYYRYMLPAFSDLYGVEFDTITDEEARSLNDRIAANHMKKDWAREVVVDRANVEMVIVDPFWSRIETHQEEDFTAPLLNVHTIIHSSHIERDSDPANSPFLFARRRGREIKSFDDFLEVVDLIFEEAVKAGAVGMKCTQAYVRKLRFEPVTRARAAAVFGLPPDVITESQQTEFEDYMMWRMAAMSASHDLPFQIHTGLGRPDGSNPMLLMNLIAGNPRTKFVLLHGGYPWIDDMAILAQTHRNVWIDASWLPTISPTVGRRAFAEWLDCVPADRILWGADSANPEAFYGAVVVTRRCLSEALADRVMRGTLREEQAIAIGRRIMRENVIGLYPRLAERIHSR